MLKICGEMGVSSFCMIGSFFFANERLRHFQNSLWPLAPKPAEVCCWVVVSRSKSEAKPPRVWKNLTQNL